MAIDWTQLLKLAPGVAAGAMGNQAGGAAFMQGLEEGRQLRLREQMLQQQQGRQSELDASRLQTEEAQRQNLTADNARAEESARMQKLQQALAMLDSFGGQVAATANDPVAAESQMLGRASSVESMFGVPQGQLSGAIPNMAPMISGRKKKQAQDLYDRAEKTYGPEAMASDSITLQTGELFGDVKPSQLRSMFSAPAVDAAGAPARPMVQPQSAGVPTTERTALAAWARERGKTPDQLSSADLLEFNKRFKQSDDRPPVHVTVGGSGLTPQQVTAAAGLRDDFRTESKDFSTVRMAHDRVAVSAKDPSAAGDLSLLYNYMKILDPNSVVRETEFAQAAKSGSLPQQIQAAATKVVNGQRLTPEQRSDFVARARALYDVANKRQTRLMARYRDIAKKSGVPEELVVIDTGDIDTPDTADRPSVSQPPSGGTKPKSGRFEILSVK